MLKLLYAALVAACALVALSVLLHLAPISAFVVRHPLLYLALVAVMLFSAFLTVLKAEPRRRFLRSLAHFGRRRAAPVGMILLGGLALSACAGLQALTGTAGGSQSALLSTAAEIAKDPNCGHTDRLAVNLGAISTGQLFLERSCPGPSSAPKPTPAPAPAAPAQ